MVLFAMTSTVVDGLQLLKSRQRLSVEHLHAQTAQSTGVSPKLQHADGSDHGSIEMVLGLAKNASPSKDGDTRNSLPSILTSSINRIKPSLVDPKIGDPISHGQIIDLATKLRADGSQTHSLEHLLKGSKFYTPPPPSKPEPTSEYKALMARLRREEEARSYERMTNPLPPMETFSQRFPTASAAHAFTANHAPPPEPEDEVIYTDIDRQISVIFNVLLSIVCCAAAIWIAARWWSTPMRLALSMSGSILVGVAEVVVYAGYIRRVGESKGKERAVKEIKEVVNTWVVGAGSEGNGSQESVLIESKADGDESRARKRK